MLQVDGLRSIDSPEQTRIRMTRTYDACRVSDWSREDTSVLRVLADAYRLLDAVVTRRVDLYCILRSICACSVDTESITNHLQAERRDLFVDLCAPAVPRWLTAFHGGAQSPHGASGSRSRV